MPFGLSVSHFNLEPKLLVIAHGVSVTQAAKTSYGFGIKDGVTVQTVPYKPAFPK
jgi:hypothetical protein